MSSNYTNWKSYTSNSKRNHLAHRSVCTWDVTNSLLIVLYIILFFCCLLLLKENSSSWQSGQSGGLLWYLSCTSVLCGCRFIGFALILYIGTDSSEGCNGGYRTFQWELEGSGDTISSLYLELLVLSTSSSALFFTSYSYFAHSLSKVLDMLTSEEDSSSTAMKYTLLLVALNTCVWCSTILLWVVRFFSLPTADTIDDIAQFSLAVAALTTCMAFGVHFQRVYCFMKRNNGSDCRTAHITGVLKLQRVLGVCSVCTVCFAIRGILLLAQIPLSPVQADAYFFLSEVMPTAFMLNAFRSSSNSYSAIELGGNRHRLQQSISSGEFEVLKERDSFSGKGNYFQFEGQSQSQGQGQDRVRGRSEGYGYTGSSIPKRTNSISMNDKNRNNSTNSNNKSSSMIVGGGGGLSVEPYHLSPCKSHTDLSLQSKVSHTDY